MQTILGSIISLIVLAPSGHAFNTPTHHQILKSAIHYLKTHVPQNALTQEWIWLAQKNQDAQNKEPLERFFVRSIIDTDYQDDLWLEAWYLKPISAGKTSVLGMLTSLYHFTNVTKEGRYWRYDGYAYQNTDKMGNDSYLGEMGLYVRADLSKPIQKYASNQTDLAMAAISMPPSYLLAIDAFEKSIDSWPSAKNQRKTWNKQITFAQSYVFNSWIYHQYASEEIKGLPETLQTLGIAMHMAQDLAMPHHSQGIAGLCHSEIEQIVDVLGCDEGVQIPEGLYDSGIFDEVSIPSCQNLYSAENVAKLLKEDPAFNIHSNMSLEDRLIQIGKMTAEYRVGRVPNMDQEGVHIMHSEKVVFSDSCEGIKNSHVIKMLAKRQYEIATAATIMLIELAAKEYESRLHFAHNMENQCVLAYTPTSKEEGVYFVN